MASPTPRKEKKEKRPRKPPVLRPKSEREYRFCRVGKGKRTVATRETRVLWQLRKGWGGRKKKIETEGYFCPNKSCEYYGITDEHIHALVGYGSHGRQEVVQDFKCQAWWMHPLWSKCLKCARLPSAPGCVAVGCRGRSCMSGSCPVGRMSNTITKIYGCWWQVT